MLAIRAGFAVTVGAIAVVAIIVVTAEAAATTAAAIATAAIGTDAAPPPAELTKSGQTYASPPSKHADQGKSGNAS
jgi:hypothetical protein